MERVLRSEEMAEIILLPVRHHSPACAWHVSRMIERLAPSVILIEGPDNANALIPAMVHEETEAPFAIYYSYHDTTARISEEKEHYRCYYPFLDHSPELAALRTGQRLGIETAFVDLPYGEILAASRQGKGLLNRDEEKNNYNDDYLLSRNAYLQQLCERTGLRCFDEFWEKYFELNDPAGDGRTEDHLTENRLTECGYQRGEQSPAEAGSRPGASEKWFFNLLTYCRLARENTPAEAMEEDGCLARERYMAARILEYAGRKAGGGPVVAVTGGFHTPGLQGLLEEAGARVFCGGLTAAANGKAGRESGGALSRDIDRITSAASSKALGETSGIKAEPEKAEKIAGGKAETEKAERIAGGKAEPEALENAGREVHRIPEKDQGVYLMPYSMEAADALNGYASGMPYTGFYQKVWDGFFMADAASSYENAVLDMIVHTGKETRRKEGYLSTYDEICACAMARGLAQLRGKRAPGAYELIDAVLSSFVKGEYTLASDTPMRILRKYMTGSAIGKLCSQANVPPIIHDFETQCRVFGWKIKFTLETEVTLNIFSNKKHRQESMFLNRMFFLKTAFARKVKGPNLQLKKDKNLMREIWKYKWNAQVNSALIDVSVYGATIEEAAAGLVKEELKKELNAKESALLLTYVFEMGLREQLQLTFDRVHELMLTDTSFSSLAEAVKSLMMMEELGSLYGTEMKFGELILLGSRKLITLLPSMTRIKDEELAQCMDALKLLYQITGRHQEREAYYDALDQMLLDQEIHSGLNGCIHGILYGSKRETAEQVELVCRGYLLGTKEQMLHTAQFFRGLFYTARDLVFIGGEFLQLLDEFFGRVSEGEFMELLPELRMAFACFTPREIDKIAAGAAGLHGKSGEELLEGQEILPEWYSYGKEIDDMVRYGRYGHG